MNISNLFQKLRDSLSGVSIFFERSVIAIKVGGKREIIIELAKNDKASIYTLCYTCTPNERLLELRDQVLCILIELGLTVDYKAPLHDYLVKMYVKRRGGSIYRSTDQLAILIENEDEKLETVNISKDDVDEVYIFPRSRQSLESLISVVKNENIKSNSQSNWDLNNDPIDLHSN